MVRWILAMVATFVTWQAMDFVIHGVMLAPTYEATAPLWRPRSEMKYGLMAVVAAIAAAAAEKNVRPTDRPRSNQAAVNCLARFARPCRHDPRSYLHHIRAAPSG